MTIQVFLIVQSLNIYNYISFYILQKDKSGNAASPLLLYQTCLDPWKKDYVIPFYKIMPLNQILLHLSTASIIGFNIFLFKFLNKQTLNNVGKREYILTN